MLKLKVISYTETEHELYVSEEIETLYKLYIEGWKAVPLDLDELPRAILLEVAIAREKTLKAQLHKLLGLVDHSVITDISLL